MITPIFLAHKNDVQNGWHQPVRQLNDREVLVGGDQPYLVSNVCPHQLSLITQERGRGNRVCPYHGWSFEQDGTPITSGRTGSYCKNKHPLIKHSVYESNSMLFNVNIQVPELDFLDLGGMNLVEQRTDAVKARPETIMDLFLDVDHIPGVHRGVYEQIGMNDVDDVRWTYYDWGSLQLVHNDGKVTAAWLALYPYTMIEWQSGAMFITVIRPGQSYVDTRVEVFKYRDAASSDQQWAMNEDIWETAWRQDREQAERIVDFTDNYDHLEPAKRHFRNRLR